jgi:tetratricopeptide (TPR) repeat protein
MRKHVFAVFVGLLFVPQATMAQSPGSDDADSSKAGVRFQRAVELYREGSYEGALAEFRKAYQTSPTYQVLYNIAQTQYALHDFVGAYKSLMQYTVEGGSDIPADRRAQVDQMSAKLVDRIAHLQILINVSGADVRVDDISVGTSPLPGLVPVNVGTRKVSAFMAGSPEVVRVVTVAGKESMKIDLRVDLPSAAPTRGVPGATTSTAAPLMTRSQVAEPPSRIGLIVTLSTTAALVVATGVCGFLALRAQQQLKDAIDTYPNTRDNIEAARKKSKNYGYATDALGAATLVSGGAALYFVLTHTWDPATPKPSKDKSLVLAPTVGGMVLQGSF